MKPETDYDILKTVVTEILLDYPKDTYNSIYDTYNELSEWELVSEREVEEGSDYFSRDIGTENIMTAMEYLFRNLLPVLVTNKLSQEGANEVVNTIFIDIINDLIEEKVIRRIPEIYREELKVINGGKENI